MEGLWIDDDEIDHDRIVIVEGPTGLPTARSLKSASARTNSLSVRAKSSAFERYWIALEDVVRAEFRNY